MARPTAGQSYGYAPQIAAPPNYYFDEPEEYVGDFSENEGLSDAAPHLVGAPNVTEIYRRKAAAAPTPEHYRQPNMYVPPSYYYEAVSPQVSHQLRRPAVPTAYQRHIPVVDERGRYYPSGALEDYRNAMVYSSPQIASVRRSATHSQPATRQVFRRHPVTVRTPRYYRRTTVSNVYKKPSALCLPVACQPDPAVYRRSITRKHSEEPTYSPQHLAFGEQTKPNPVIRRHSGPMTVNNNAIEAGKRDPREYSGDLYLSESDVDAVLARYETIIGDHADAVVAPVQQITSCPSKTSTNTKPSKAKLFSDMKPKVPSSIKHKQERLRKSQENAQSTPSREKQKHRPNSPCNSERLELEEITTEVLDSMLSELMESGCKNAINENLRENANDTEGVSKALEYSEEKIVGRPPSGNSKIEAHEFPRSFNYHDISQNMSKSQNNINKSQHNIPLQPANSSQNSTPLNSPRFELATASSKNSNLNQQSTSKTSVYHPVDRNSAMELHRSKSYIVSLIDRALSKELGTVPERPASASRPRPSTPTAVQGNEQTNTQHALNLMNKNYEKMDKGLCLEITQALTNSIVSNTTTTCAQAEVKHASCSCNVQDEPLYVKQLKQLRWGHLKHIQREVRRLEDLERFLDSCSSGSPM